MTAEHPAGAGAAEPLPPLLTARWPQVDVSDRRLLIWPVGATEQHGPHLPLGTDLLIASALADRLHQQFPGTGLAPALPIGASGEHQHFPGTLSIGTSALTEVVIEFVRHATLFWSRVLIVNGHGGNGAALDAAAALLATESQPITVFDAASGGPHTDAHAGYRETSLMLHLYPDLVRTELIEPGNPAALPNLMPTLGTQGVRAVSPNGILGDPTAADPDHGATVFADMLGRLISIAAGLLGLGRELPSRKPTGHP